MSRASFWFIAVGGAAALTHLSIFALAQHWMWPEAANALGFGVAFFVSFFGHRLLSFQDSGVALGQSLARFGATALLGLAVNEFIFSVLLRLANWPSLLALFSALVLTAAQTFVLSRFWAFRR